MAQHGHGSTNSRIKEIIKELGRLYFHIMKAIP
jgi:hypothetical protein